MCKFKHEVFINNTPTIRLLYLISKYSSLFVKETNYDILKQHIVNMFDEAKQLVESIFDIFMIINNRIVVVEEGDMVIDLPFVIEDLGVKDIPSYTSQDIINDLFNFDTIKNNQYILETIDDISELFVAPIMYNNIPISLLIVKIHSDSPEIFVETLALLASTISSAVIKVIHLSNIMYKNKFIKAMYNVIPDYLWSKDANGLYTFLNKKTLEFLDANSVDDALGKSYDYFHNIKKAKYSNQNFNPDIVHSTDEQVMNNKKAIHYTESGFNKNVHETYSIYKAPILNVEDNVTGILGHAINLTEQVKLQKELYQRDTLLKLVTDQIPNLILVRDTNNTVVYVNKPLVDVISTALNIKRVDIIGKSYKEVFFYDEQFVDRLSRIDKVILTSKEPIKAMSYVSNDHWYEFTHLPLLYNNEIIGIISIGLNITEQIKELENIKKEVERVTYQYLKNSTQTHIDMKRELNNMKEKLSILKSNSRNGGA